MRLARKSGHDKQHPSTLLLFTGVLLGENKEERAHVQKEKKKKEKTRMIGRRLFSDGRKYN